MKGALSLAACLCTLLTRKTGNGPFSPPLCFLSPSVCPPARPPAVSCLIFTLMLSFIPTRDRVETQVGWQGQRLTTTKREGVPAAEATVAIRPF